MLPAASPAQAADGPGREITYRLRVVDAQLSEGPASLLDSRASVAVVLGRGVAKLVEHDVEGVGHPRRCWMPIVTRPGS